MLLMSPITPALGPNTVAVPTFPAGNQLCHSISVSKSRQDMKLRPALILNVQVLEIAI
jgi:hypothetical protein